MAKFRTIKTDENFHKQALDFLERSEDLGYLDQRAGAQFALSTPGDKGLTKGFNSETAEVRSMLIVSSSSGTGNSGVWLGENRMQHDLWLIGGVNQMIKVARNLSGSSSKPMKGELVVSRITTLNSKINKNGEQDAKSSMTFKFMGANGGEWIIFGGEWIVLRIRTTGFDVTVTDRTAAGQKGKSKIKKQVMEFASLAKISQKNAVKV